MKRTGKSVSFIVVALVLLLAFTACFGVSNYFGDIRTTYFKGAEDIRWGIDISGGVEAIFVPDKDVEDISDEDMDSAKEIISTRLLYNNITDSEIYVDYDNHQVIVRFPWKSDEENYNPTEAVKELGEMAVLTFREGNQDEDGAVVLQGASDIESATAAYEQSTGYVVQLKLTSEGTTKFATATKKLLNNYITIYMDKTMLSAPKVNAVISDGNAIITGMSSAEEAQELASKINAGSLPFALTVDDSKLQVVSPTYGQNALNTMLIAGIIALAAICILMVSLYRLPGIVASICLFGQIGGIIACISGYFPGLSSFTLTTPGIVGIILSIGMGVDANVVTNERIREELAKNKTVDGAIKSGYKSAISAIIDGNITNIIVAVVLMAAFGNPDSFLCMLFSKIFPFLSSSITGSIYSFGYTLLIGALWNLIMGVVASRLILTSLVKFKFFRNIKFYGKAKQNLKTFAFTKNVKKSLIIVAALLVVGTTCLAIFGVNLDINFAGGSIVSYSYTGDIDIKEAEGIIKSNTKYNFTVTQNESIAGDKSILSVSVAAENGLTRAEQVTINNALAEKYKANNLTLHESNNVSASIGKNFFVKSMFAVVLAAAFVVIYVAIRFKHIGGASAAVSSLIALVHDVIITFLFCTAFGIQIDTNFIAVVLTLFGYSLNDTIVMYDRIRENNKKYPELSREELVDKSITETFKRSIVTASTTIIAVVSVLVVAELRGVESLRSLVIPMIVGLVAGCFSSVFLAGPLWVKWHQIFENRDKNKKKVGNKKKA